MANFDAMTTIAARCRKCGADMKIPAANDFEAELSSKLISLATCAKCKGEKPVVKEPKEASLPYKD